MQWFYGNACGQPHPELVEREGAGGDTLDAVTCTARFKIILGEMSPHLGKHRARLGRHLIRWS